MHLSGKKYQVSFCIFFLLQQQPEYISREEQIMRTVAGTGVTVLNDLVSKSSTQQLKEYIFYLACATPFRMIN